MEYHATNSSIPFLPLKHPSTLFEPLGLTYSRSVPRLPPLASLGLSPESGLSTSSSDSESLSCATFAQPPSSPSISHLIHQTTLESPRPLKHTSASRPTLPALASAIPFTQYSLSSAKRLSPLLRSASPPWTASASTGVVSYHQTASPRESREIPHPPRRTMGSPPNTGFPFSKPHRPSTHHFEPRHMLLPYSQPGAINPAPWFARGTLPRAELHTWSRDSIKAYDIGSEDALRAVHEGVVGIGDHQYHKPTLVHGGVPSHPDMSPRQAPSFPVHTDARSPTYFGETTDPTSTDRKPDLNHLPESPTRRHSATPTPAGASRFSRQPISCFPCRGRKLRCDGAVPCAQCAQRGSMRRCVYAEGVRRRGKGKKREEGVDINCVLMEDVEDLARSGSETLGIRSVEGKGEARSARSIERMDVKQDSPDSRRARNDQ